MEYIPYTYLIGWSSLNKWYYGVEYGFKKRPCANPSNLWTKYFTSSSTVHFCVAEFGDPDIIVVRKVFNRGTDVSRMESAIKWEKTVLTRIDIADPKWLNGRIGGDICPETSKKINLLRYGVENVFQSDEIKAKIKQSNLKRWGVEHPSYSPELLAKKTANNLLKFGVSCVFELPEVREKCNEAIRRPETKTKRKNTNVERYGAVSPSQCDSIKAKMLNTRRALSERVNVKLIREYKRVFGISLKQGWYQSPDADVLEILADIQKQYGVFSVDHLEQIELVKKYSDSIKKLQSRELVVIIKKYKELFPGLVKIGRSWDRKSDDALQQILSELQQQLGDIK